MLDQAVAYFRRGWCVLPLCWPVEDGRCGCGRHHRDRDVGKAPLVGLYTAITLDEIEAWWSRWPQANIGLLLWPSRVLVVDADGPEAVAEAERLGLPPTLTASTGRGKQWFFAAPAGTPRARATKRGETQGIDVLADGYVVLPPSRHRSGKVYTWLNDLPLAEPPEWALKALREAVRVPQEPLALPDALPTVTLEDLRVGKTIKDLIVNGDFAAHGYPSRSEAIFAVIRVLYEAGHTPEEIAAVLLNPDWRIGEKLREKSDPLAAVRGELERFAAKAAEGAEEEVAVEVEVGPQEEQSPGPDRGIRLVTAREFIELTREAGGGRSYIIKGLLPSSSLALLAGLPKQGKTTLCMHAVKAILTSTPFLRRETVAVPVVYMPFEASPHLIADVMEHVLGPLADKLQVAIGSPRLRSPEAVEDVLASVIKAVGSSEGLLVIDSLTTALGLRGEGAYSDLGVIGPLIQASADVAYKTGWTVMWIAHTRKRPRGDFRPPTIEDVAHSFGITALVDVVWLWQRGPRGKPGILRVDGRVPAEELKVFSSRNICELFEEKPEWKYEAMRLIQTSEGGMTAEELAAALRVDVDRVQAVLDEAVLKGEIAYRDEGGVVRYKARAIRLSSDEDLDVETA